MRPFEVYSSLLLAGAEQIAALEAATRRGLVHARPLATCLQATLLRLDLVRAECETELPTMLPGAASSDINALWTRARPLLAMVTQTGELVVRRFSAHAAREDPLAAFRSGPQYLVDVSSTMISGVSRRQGLGYRVEMHGGIQPQEAESVIFAVKLRNADLAKSRFSMAQLMDVDAHGADLSDAAVDQVRFSRVDLTGASLRGANLQYSHAAESDLSGADLSGAQWHDGTVSRCTLAGADLSNLRGKRLLFIDCDLRGADLTLSDTDVDATLEGARFYRCDLRWSCWNERASAMAQFVSCTSPGNLRLWTASDEEVRT